MNTLTVRRVNDETGSHIEPPLDENWTPLTKLEWLAAVVSADTELKITVGPGSTYIKDRGQWKPIPGTYSVYVRESTVAGALGYSEAWSFLNGIETGARAERRRRRDEVMRALGCTP